MRAASRITLSVAVSLLVLTLLIALLAAGAKKPVVASAPDLDPKPLPIQPSPLMAASMTGPEGSIEPNQEVADTQPAAVAVTTLLPATGENRTGAQLSAGIEQGEQPEQEPVEQLPTRPAPPAPPEPVTATLLALQDPIGGRTAHRSHETVIPDSMEPQPASELGITDEEAAPVALTPSERA
ncbi:MAG: hypothetical protein RRC07_15185, partial [Anaerolineae bacterium]|nr:hypothetical protein [Anaerolineae bacterium]